MLARVNTFTLTGVDARPVWAEVDVRAGLPAFPIVGLADAATREARERVRVALRRTHFAYPAARITANLAPAHLANELDAFQRHAVRALSSATNDGHLTALRGAEATRLPSRFQLIATARPCPDGCRTTCHCSRTARTEYRSLIASRRDPFDMTVNVEAPDHSAPLGPTTGEIRQRVLAAREILRRDPSPLAAPGAYSRETPDSLPTRRMHVAASIAALDGRDRPTRDDIQEAASYTS